MDDKNKSGIQKYEEPLKVDYVTRRTFRPIPVIVYEGAQVEFCGVTYCSEEKNIELGFWVKNNSLDILFVFAKTLAVNGEQINEVTINGEYYDDYFLIGEYAEGQEDYSYITISEEVLLDICSYENIKTIEFAIEIADNGDMLLCENKIFKILCDTKREVFKMIN